MKPNLFTPIDLQTWPLTQMFTYYTQMAPTTYTVNVSMDVTTLRNTLKNRGMKFFPAYLYLITSAIQKQPELRIAKRDGVLGIWDRLTPAYPQFHEDDHTTSLLWTEYSPAFMDFYHDYLEDTRQYGASHGILSAKGLPPASTYIISCIPWFTFNSFSLHNHGIQDYFFPSFEAGGFQDANGRILMPLSVTVHHATMDGYGLKVFFERLQHSMNHPEEWLAP